MSDLAEQVGIGGAVAVLLVATVMKFLPAFMAALKQQNGKGRGNKSGELDPAEWEKRIGKVVAEELAKVMSGRNEEVRRIIHEELERR
jgi:hypothetical protein